MSHGTLTHAPLGGRYFNGFMKVVVALSALFLALVTYRYAFGLGAVTNLNNGYPWGIWIAFDVVVGTALGCGGYAVAILVYVMNNGRYHPLIRPAVLTSLLGYVMGAVGVMVDLGRVWEMWKVPTFFWRWTSSPQLEVALCIMAYCFVLAIEMSPALFERLEKEGRGGVRKFAAGALGFLEKSLPFVLALGVLLPTMHQSSLGTMMLLVGPKLHALWSTSWLPFLFLLSALVMGYGIVVCEAAFSGWAFDRPRETRMLARLSKAALGIGLFFVLFRVAEVAWAGELGLVLGPKGGWFVLEVLVHLAAVVILASAARRASAVWQTRAGFLMVAGGTLYRVNTYLVAFQPGAHFSYFPAIPEMLITIGAFATEIAIYVYAVRRFPILAGHASHAPAAAR
jgi:Ni/Fe-hydrogenase subunit HybB-like protein